MLIGIGAMVLSYRLQNKLTFLIHSNYVQIATLTGVLLIGLGGYRLALSRSQPQDTHTSLLSPRVGTSLVLLTAFWGLVLPPQPLSSQTAINRGISQTIGVFEDQPQTFQPQVDTTSRSLIDWIRTLEVYPDPKNYENQLVDVEGFVIYPEETSDDAPETFWLGRFLIRCCAADAYPVALPVQAMERPPIDSWQRVQGVMVVASSLGSPLLMIQATSIDPIPTPDNPYAY